MARTLKIAAWNIARGYRPEEICRVLRVLEADVYLLSEVDRGNRRTGNVDVFRTLEESLGLAGRFAVEFEEKHSVWRTLIPQGGPGGGVHGNAVFSRLPMEDYREIRLPVGEKLRWEGTTIVPELFEPRNGSRVAQVFEARFEGTAISFVNAHLENWRCGWELRRRQLDEALSDVRGTETVLGGDMNCLEGVLWTVGRTRPVNREVPVLRRRLAGKGLSDPWTDTDYTNFNFGVRAKLDWLCVSNGLEVVEKDSLRTGLSDHNCLAATVRLR